MRPGTVDKLGPRTNWPDFASWCLINGGGVQIRPGQVESAPAPRLIETLQSTHMIFAILKKVNYLLVFFMRKNLVYISLYDYNL